MEQQDGKVNYYIQTDTKAQRGQGGVCFELFEMNLPKMRDNPLDSSHLHIKGSFQKLSFF